MKISKYLSLLFFIFCRLSSVVIVTHGAFAQKSSWYQPGGKFFEELKKEDNNLNHEIISFSWKQNLGGVTHYELMNAGIELSKLILDFAKKEGKQEIILIGHSYGGHVIKVASQLLDDFVDNFEMYDIKFKIFSDNFLDKKSIEMFEREKLDLQAAFLQAQKEVQKYKNTLGFEEKRNNKNYLIDSVYTLGTPNDIQDYVASMNIIGKFYNFYSKGDLVQGAVGNVLLPDPKHDRSDRKSTRLNSSHYS